MISYSYLSFKEPTMRNTLLPYCFILCCLTTLLTNAQITKTTNADGNWSNDTIWTPFGVPSTSNGDTIVVGHSVWIGSNLNLSSSTQLMITNSGSLSYFPVAKNISFSSSATLINNGLLSVDTMTISNSAGVIRNDSAAFIGSNYLLNFGTFINDSMARVNIWYDLNNYDSIQNNYFIEVRDLINSGRIGGMGGQFCVVGSSFNSGALYATIDICPPLDINTGTVDIGVTFCSSSLSVLCFWGIDNLTQNKLPLTIYPNPANTSVTIELPEEALHKALSLEVYTIAGKLVQTIEAITDAALTLDIADYPKGMYICNLVVEGIVQGRAKLFVQ